MLYQPVNALLTDLDEQQRRELAALPTLVDATELERVRNSRKQLAASAVFFIERTWEQIGPMLPSFSLEAETGQSTAEIAAYLARLRQRQPAYAWGWIRARMDARLMEQIEACLPYLLRQHPEMAALYEESLSQLHPYWFRETPLLHLKAGYHTALGVACKWYGSTFELLLAAPHACPEITVPFHANLRLFASFSLTMLERTDRYLWDSAGAKPLKATVEDGTLKVAYRSIPELRLPAAPDYGLRAGCPALRARSEHGLPAFPGIIDWVKQVFSHYLLAGQAE